MYRFAVVQRLSTYWADERADMLLTEGEFNDMHACMPACIVILCLAIAMGVINCHMACNLSLTISLNPLVPIYIYMQARLVTPELKVISMTCMHVCLYA